MSSWYDRSHTALQVKLEKMRPAFAVAAQKVYDEWEQDDEGMDPTLGPGGICQDIAESIGDILTYAGIDCTIMEAQTGDQHVWVLAYDDEGGVHVDISPSVYESGGGYSWSKLPDVEFDGGDIDIWRADEDTVAAARQEGF